MNEHIDDDLLIAVLEGRASNDAQQAVELAIQQEPRIRLRMEQLSGAVDWPLGSAPLVSQPISESLHTAILRLEQDWEQVLATRNSEPNVGRESIGDSEITAIPPLRIVREIGRGGMGVVYEGFDDALGRRVAIKQLHLHFLKDAKARERLKREAQAIASLSHPNVLAIYGTQQVGGYPCLIQQFVDGESLQATIRRDGPIEFPRCAELALQIAKGLAAAHAAGIIHRDLKPDNVLVEHGTGVARLCDFGLAKRVGDENMTVEGVVAGTPAFMAPEQTEGKAVDHRSDLFSLGALMYTMAAGRAPFENDDPFVVMNAIRSRPHPPLDSPASPIPNWYARLVDCLLEKDPERRPQSIDQVIQSLQSQTSPGASARSMKRTPWIAAAALGLFAVAATGWYALVNKGVEQRVSRPVEESPRPRRPAIVTASNDTAFDRLEDAVASAVDGETIVLASDVESGRIEISGKNLRFEAAPETRPCVRFRAARNESSGVFLRSDSDMSFKGLRIECQTSATTSWFEDGKIVAGISTGRGKRLHIEDCQIARVAGGVCLGVGGDLEIRRTWIQGGDLGIAWFALDSTCRVEDSIIQSNVGVGIIYPAAGIQSSRTSEFTLERSSIVAECALEVLLARIPSRPATVQLKRCVLDAEHVASLRLTPNAALEINTSQTMIDALIQSMQWRDETCVFAQGMDYLIARRLRTPNRKTSAGIFSLEKWTERCAQDHASDSTEEPSSIECKIETHLPDAASRWKSSDSPGRKALPGSPASIHRLTPELPNSWLDSDPVP